MNEEEQFFQAARRSYTHLDHHARQCIAICAVYPRNYQVERNDLIHLWMANRLLILSAGGGGGEQCSLEDKGQNILDELACRSFLKKSNKKFVPLYYLSHGYHSMLMYTMSVLNQKLARNVMQKECATLVAGSRLDMLPPRVRHMYVASNCEIFDILETLRKFPNLLTLLSPYRHRNPFQPCSKSPPKELNSTNKGRKLPKEMPLRVLDLRGSRILKVPNDLGNLEQLRYLNLSNTQIKALPESVAALLNLQTLNLSSCYYLQRLPSEMSKMISLRHLFIDNCERLLHMPSSMGKLSQLQTLSKYIVGQEAGRGLQQLKDLKLGGKIELKGLKNSATGAAKETNLLSKKNLHSVVLDWRLFKLTLSGVVEDNNDFMPVNQDQEVLEALEPHNELKSLEVCQYPGARFASWMMDSNKFQRLIEIYLRDCNKCEVLPPLAHLPTLEVIFLSKMNAIKYFCHSKEQLFPSLKVLIISDMLNLEDWVENPEADFVIPYLVELTVCNCPKLIKLPKLPSIKYLDIRGIN